MAKKRINELTEATSVKTDHYIPVDHGTDGTQKMSMATLIDSTLAVSGKAADSKAVGDAITSVKNNLSATSICKNLIGMEVGTLYPAYIPAGTKVTMSTSDGSTMPSGSGVQLRLYNSEGVQTDYWSFSNNQSYRTFTTSSSKADTYYVAWSAAWDVPLQVEIGETATTYEEYFFPAKRLSELVTNNISDIKVIGHISQMKDTIIITDLEDGYYSNNDGTKQKNSASSNYKRSVTLIPVEEKALYYGDDNYSGVCFDSDKVFIETIYFDSKTTKSKRKVIPPNTAYIGLFATGATEFVLHKIDSSDVQSAEYPYTSDDYLHLESCWCNGTGGVTETANFDLLVLSNVKAGEKYYVSNNATYNCLCFDASGNLLTSTSEARNAQGRIWTVPENAVQAYFNLYRARTKGTNSEMIDYVAKLNGKNVLAIGDSITWLDGRQNYGGASYFSGWQRQLRLAGYDVVNAGWSGYPYATGLDIVDNVDYSIFKEIVTNAYTVTGYDFIILFGGTNDVLYNGTIGSRIADYSSRTFDASTFNGALGAIINYIRTNNTTAKILLASFPKSEAASRTYANASQRVEEIQYNADFWSCKYVNIFADMNVQPTYDGFDLYFYDTTHPNFDGMQKIGKLMLNALEAYE